MHRDELGAYGERTARTYLEARGFSTLHANWRHRHLELDLVCTHAGQLVVVEVKTRETAQFGEPWEFLTRSQRRNIIRAADAYVHRYEIDLQVRFDVVSVVHNRHGTRTTHFPDAFYPML